MALTLLFPPSLGRPKAGTRAELLAESLSRRLGQPVEVSISSSYAELEDAVVGGRVAMAWAPPSICASAQLGARVILKAVRHGRSTYRAALIGRTIDHLDLPRLVDRCAGWVDPLAAAGHLLPLELLRSRGIDLERVILKQRFFGSYRESLLALLRGECDYTAVFCHEPTEADVRDVLTDFVGASEMHLSVLGFTDETPADGLIVGAQLPLAEADRLVEVLSTVTDGSRGPTLLLELFDAETLIPAAPDDYAVLRRALPLRRAS